MKRILYSTLHIMPFRLDQEWQVVL